MSARAAPRVAIVYRLDRMGGVQSVAHTLIRGLNRRGIIPDILWDLPPDSRLMAERGLQARYQPVKFAVPSKRIDRLPNTLRYLAWVPNLVRSRELPERYDFYYIFYNGFLVEPGEAHVRYLSGPPLLPQLQEETRAPFRALRWLYRRALRRRWPVYEYHREDHYVINSHFTAGLFEQAHGVRLPVVHPPIDVSDRSYDPADLPARDTLTFFSRIVDYKRPEIVLQLAARHPELRCVIMGGVAPVRRPYFEQLQALARSLGRPDAVFLDNPSNQRVREELARTRFYVFPGINEHFGMTTVEAIASGAVPFVHDSGGQREIVHLPELRFRDEDLPGKFDGLAAYPEGELARLRSGLAGHIRQFSAESFTAKMLALLDESVERERAQDARQAEQPPA